MGEAAVVSRDSGWVDGLHLGDDVEVAAAPVALERDVVVGSSRAPKRLPGLRMPLATARILPWPWVRMVTMRSVSPSLILRKTTP